MDFPNFNGPVRNSGRNLRSMLRLVESVVTSKRLSQHSFSLFLQLLSCDLMFTVVTCSLQLLISGRDMNSLSRHH